MTEEFCTTAARIGFMAISSSERRIEEQERLSHNTAFRNPLLRCAHRLATTRPP
jgi:hypothetical protein